MSAGLVVSLILMGQPARAQTAINNESDLQNMTSSGNYIMTTDIALSGSWTPHTFAFTGTLDGGGYTISGLNEATGGQPRGGIFNDLRGTVKNLTLTGTFSGQWQVGALAGYVSNATVSNCTFDITASSSGEKAGIVVGDAYGVTLIEVTVSGSIACNGAAQVGALIGRMTGGSITECRSSANVLDTSAGGNSIGGLVGWQNGGTIQRSFCSGAVSSGKGYLGGLVGYLAGSGTIRDSYATGNVTNTVLSSLQTGGLVGKSTSGSTIDRCYASGDIHCVGTGWAGGLVGDNYSTLDDSFSVGEVTYQWVGYVGGSIGYERAATANNTWWYNSNASGVGGGNSSGFTKASAASDFYDDANEPLASWDFATVWVEEPGDYPQLQAFADAPVGASGTMVTIK